MEFHARITLYLSKSCSPSHYYILHTKLVIACSSPALFRRDLRATRIQESLWKGEDGPGGKPNCALKEKYLKTGHFCQHFLRANRNALSVLILTLARSPWQPTGRTFGSKLHFACFLGKTWLVQVAWTHSERSRTYSPSR